MNLCFPTTSFCPACYLELPATVSVRADGVWLDKKCPVHGATRAMVERDPIFYTYVRGLHSPSIYGGYFVDVTRTCNLRCSICYYDLQKTDPEGLFTVDAILNECRANARHAPFIFTGGEPTLHPELETLIREASAIGPFELLTNGVRLADREFYDRIMPLVTFDGVANLNLSVHGKETVAWQTVLGQCRADAVKVESLLFVIDGRDSLLAALKVCEQWSDVVAGFRFKAATRLWNEQKPAERVFCSDMLRWLEEAGYEPRFLLRERNNKIPFINLLCRAPGSGTPLFLMPVSWNDVENVDLDHINCAPYYKARTGEVYNFVTAGLINEGLQRGWMKGARLENGTTLSSNAA